MSEIAVWNACNPHLGRGIQRVVEAVGRYAPEGVRFVSKRADADLIIAHVVGKGELDYLQRTHAEQRVILWQYCWHTSDVADWRAVWDGCDLVASYYRLPTDKLYHTPLGVDPEVFYPMAEVPKTVGIVGTGYVAETECLREAYEACRELGLPFAHIGQDFGWGEGYVHLESVADDVMRRLYNQSYLALATRHIEGFELPAVEAAACGTVPVLLDLPCYRWAEPLCPVWIDPQQDVRGQLVDQLHAARLFVDSNGWTERRMALGATAHTLFHWQRIMGAFWDEVGQRFGPE